MSAERNDDGLTFRQWMRQVDLEVARHCGLSASDLADQCYWDQWHDGVPPAEAAEEALLDEGFPFDSIGF